MIKFLKRSIIILDSTTLAMILIYIAAKGEPNLIILYSVVYAVSIIIGSVALNR